METWFNGIVINIENRLTDNGLAALANDIEAHVDTGARHPVTPFSAGTAMTIAAAIREASIDGNCASWSLDEGHQRTDRRRRVTA